MALAGSTDDDRETRAVHADSAANGRDPVRFREVAQFLDIEKQLIIEASAAALRGAAPHYRAADPEEVRRRLERLYDELTDAASSHDLGGIVRYAKQLAEARFFAGYDLSEIQVAFNTLEEAVWARITSALQPEQLGPALGIVSTILGVAKDALAREYVSLATRSRAPSLDYDALFRGSAGS